MNGPTWRLTWGIKKTEMSFDPKAYLMTANVLLPQATTEAEYRTIAGRAYYAVYGIIRKEVCDAAGYSPFSGVGKHGKLIKLMAQTGNRRLKRAAPHLRNLRDLRVRSDYKYRGRDAIGHAQAKNATKVAAAAIADLGNMQSYRPSLKALARFL